MKEENWEEIACAAFLENPTLEDQPDEDEKAEEEIEDDQDADLQAQKHPSKKHSKIAPRRSFNVAFKARTQTTKCP